MQSTLLLQFLFFLRSKFFVERKRKKKTNKKKNQFGGSILNFLSKIPSKNNVPQKEFLKDLGFLLSRTSYKFNLWRSCG